MNLRKINRIIHRDFGYFFFGMTFIYALSGIGLNHIEDWNPSYIIQTKEVKLNKAIAKETVSKDFVINVLTQYDEGNSYKKHYFPTENTLKAFIKNGSMTLNLADGSGIIEKVKKRPIFNQINILHYNNPGRLYTWFSDIFAGALIIIAISGLFILKGKNSIKGRGAWLTIAGILIPLVFIFLSA